MLRDCARLELIVDVADDVLLRTVNDGEFVSDSRGGARTYDKSTMAAMSSNTR